MCVRVIKLKLAICILRENKPINVKCQLTCLRENKTIIKQTIQEVFDHEKNFLIKIISFLL